MKFVPPSEFPASRDLEAPATDAPTRKLGATLPQRALLLLACVALGLGAGFVGLHFTSSTAWFLAIPVCMAIGWFFVADPTACTATFEASNHERPMRR